MTQRFIVTMFVIVIILINTGCVSVSLKTYARAEQNLCDCLSGVLAPADEFCTEWSRDVTDSRQKLEHQLARIKNPDGASVIQVELDSIIKNPDGTAFRPDETAVWRLYRATTGISPNIHQSRGCFQPIFPHCLI